MWKYSSGERVGVGGEDGGGMEKWCWHGEGGVGMEKVVVCTWSMEGSVLSCMFTAGFLA